MSEEPNVTISEERFDKLVQELRDERTVTANMRWTVKGLLSHPAEKARQCVCIFHEAARAIAYGGDEA